MMKRFDLHVHSKYSFDCLTEPKSVYETCVKKGIGGVAVVDHDSFEGSLKLSELVRRDRRGKGLISVKGMEVASDVGDVLALFIQEPVKARDFASVKDEVRSQDGLLSIAHPFKRGDAVRGNAEALEVLNGRLSPEKNARALEYAVSKGKRLTAGSDAHFAGEIGSAFLFAEGVETENDLLKRIRAGRVLPFWFGQKRNPLSSVLRRVKRFF